MQYFRKNKKNFSTKIWLADWWHDSPADMKIKKKVKHKKKELYEED